MQDVGVFRHQIHIPVAHHFGDDPEPGSRARLRQQLQSFRFEALEIVGRSARLEGSAAQQLGARAGHSFGRCHDLFFALYRTGASHYDEIVAADFAVEQADYGPVRMEFTAHEFVGGRNPHRLFHLRHGFHGFQTGGDVTHAHHSDHDALLAFDGVDFVVEIPDPFAYFLNLRPARM